MYILDIYVIYMYIKDFCLVEKIESKHIHYSMRIPYMKSLRFTFWADDYTSDKDLELFPKLIVDNLEGFNVRIDIKRFKGIAYLQEALDSNPHILMVDYGGLSVYSSLEETCIDHTERQLFNFTKEHPDCFIIVWSDMGYVTGYMDLVRKELGIDQAARNFHVDCADTKKLYKKLKAWFCLRECNMKTSIEIEHSSSSSYGWSCDVCYKNFKKAKLINFHTKYDDPETNDEETIVCKSCLKRALKLLEK